MVELPNKCQAMIKPEIYPPYALFVVPLGCDKEDTISRLENPQKCLEIDIQLYFFAVVFHP